MLLDTPNPNVAMSLLLSHAVLLILIASAAITDLKHNCIYNWQTYTAACLGLGLNIWVAGWQGLWWSASGLVVGFTLLFVFYLSGGFGAGDVKLLAAIGALEGTTFVLWTMVYAALLGGIMAFAVMIWKGVFGDTIKSCLYLVRHPFKARKELEKSPNIVLPYGLAISAGSCWAFFVLQP